jgi:hypothetical protein
MTFKDSLFMVSLFDLFRRTTGGSRRTSPLWRPVEYIAAEVLEIENYEEDLLGTHRHVGLLPVQLVVRVIRVGTSAHATGCVCGLRRLISRA